MWDSYCRYALHGGGGGGHFPEAYRWPPCETQWALCWFPQGSSCVFIGGGGTGKFACLMIKSEVFNYFLKCSLFIFIASAQHLKAPFMPQIGRKKATKQKQN